MNRSSDLCSTPTTCCFTGCKGHCRAPGRNGSLAVLEPLAPVIPIYPELAFANSPPWVKSPRRKARF